MGLTADEKAVLLAVWREPGHFAIFYALALAVTGPVRDTLDRLIALEKAGLLRYDASPEPQGGWSLTTAGRKLL